ncbi:MAG: tripartite tricarboxylate transporter substrate binding protein [Rhizobiales bacterium]|nr:tripartite tricarboxylate transporter substrate binding protein [Hyphomicrobiales bacterium]
MIAKLKLLVAAALMLALAWPSVPSVAQSWPQRTVKFIIPFGAGAGADIGARLFAERLSKQWGQPVVIENRPGADGIVAITGFLNANDDHTLLFGASGSFTVHPFQFANVPYRAEDIVPVARVSNTIIVVSVPASSKSNTLADLVAAARAAPDKLNAALVPGITEWAFLGFLKHYGLTMTKVPYRDIAQAVPDLAEDRVQVMMSSLAIVQPGVTSGKVKLLVVTGRERVPQLPAIPTAAEVGFPALELEGLAGLFGPRKLPVAMRERIAADMKAAAADGVIGARLAATGQVINIGGPAEFAESIERQREHVAGIAKLLRIKPPEQ